MRDAVKAVTTFFIVVILAVAILAACQHEDVDRPLDEVTVQLAGEHNSQFAGFYVAVQNNFYAQEGLDVILLPLDDQDVDVVAPTVEGNVDFALTLGANLLTARAEGQPVIAIAAIYQSNPLVFISLASSDIKTPYDFPGHAMQSLASGSGALSYTAMMAWLGVDVDSIEYIDVGTDPSSFLNGEVDIWTAYGTNEVLTAREQGFEINVIFPDDYGVHFYGDTLFTTEKMIDENPDLILRFLRATLNGWRWAIENPAEAGFMALIYDPELDANHEEAQMAASIPFIHTGQNQLGWMQAEMWEGMHNILLEQGLIEIPVDLEQVYSMEFLRQVYGAQE